MNQLAPAIVIMLMLSAGLFALGARVARGIRPRTASLIAAAGCLALLAYVYLLMDSPALTWMLPVANVVVWGGWLPPLGAFVAGIAWVRIPGGRLRRGVSCAALLAVALYGLLIDVVDPAGPPRIAAKAAIALVIAAALGGLALGSDAADGTGPREAVSSLFDAVSGFGPIILLVGLGLPLMRQRLWEGYWRFLPLGLGLGTIPALAVGVVLETALHELYLEVPLVAIGSAWMLLGYRMRIAARAQSG